MNTTSQSLYTPAILSQALQAFGLSDPRPLEGVTAWVYACQSAQGPCVLKISHALETPPDQLEGELDIIQFLARQGVAVAAPLTSLQGNLLETIPAADGSRFLAAASRMAPGEVLPDEDDINLPPAALDRLLLDWGRLAGQIDRLCKDYRPARPALARMHWDDEDLLWDVDAYLPRGQACIRRKVGALFEKFRSLPRDANSYGLIHCDLHHGNFAIDAGGRLTVFDFGSCMHHWYIQEIACALYFALPCPPARVDDRRTFAPRFLEPFLTGYLSENRLDLAWLALLPDFLAYERLACYALYLHQWDLQHLSPAQSALLARYRHLIENDIPVVDFDFARWAATWPPPA